MTLIEEMALAIINAHRARIPLSPLTELPIDTKMGNDSHEIERVLQQATAALGVVERRLLSGEVIEATRYAIYEAPSIDCAVVALKAAIQAAKEGE